MVLTPPVLVPGWLLICLGLSSELHVGLWVICACLLVGLTVTSSALLKSDCFSEAVQMAPVGGSRAGPPPHVACASAQGLWYGPGPSVRPGPGMLSVPESLAAGEGGRPGLGVVLL